MSLILDNWEEGKCRYEKAIFFPNDEYIDLLFKLDGTVHASPRCSIQSLIDDEPDGWTELNSSCESSSDEYIVKGGGIRGWVALVDKANGQLKWILRLLEGEVVMKLSLDDDSVRAVDVDYPIRSILEIPLKKPEALSVIRQSMKKELPEAEMQEIWEEIVREYYAEGHNSLSQREKVWWDIQTFDALSNNGGFVYYFDLSAGDDIQWLLDSLQLVGAPRTREAVLGLLKVFPGSWPSPDETERKDQIENLIEEHGLDELEELFEWKPNCISPSGEDLEPLETLVWRYWLGHP